MIYLGADHNGFKYKEKIKQYLEKRSLGYIDLGAGELAPQDDYPDYAFLVAKKTAADLTGRGILLCGSGNGMAIAANKINLLSDDYLSIGTATVLVSILATPFLFKSAIPLWRKVKAYDLFHGWNKKAFEEQPSIENHVIICGFGRVGRWVGMGLQKAKIDFVAIDYNQKKVHEARNAAVKIIYGDPSESEVLEMANIRKARAVVIALPDRLAQEEIVGYVQTIAPTVKIYARAAADAEFEKLKRLKIKKVIQPEFETAIAILKSIFVNLGKEKEEIGDRLLSLRKAHSALI